MKKLIPLLCLVFMLIGCQKTIPETTTATEPRSEERRVGKEC